MTLDGDATFAFEVHGIKRLFPHLAQFNLLGHLKDTVRQGGLAVVNVCNDAKISDMLEYDFFHAVFLW